MSSLCGRVIYIKQSTTDTVTVGEVFSKDLGLFVRYLSLNNTPAIPTPSSHSIRREVINKLVINNNKQLIDLTHFFWVRSTGWLFEELKKIGSLNITLAVATRSLKLPFYRREFDFAVYNIVIIFNQCLFIFSKTAVRDINSGLHFFERFHIPVWFRRVFGRKVIRVTMYTDKN